MVTENSAVPDKSLLAQYLPANYTDAYSKEVSGRDETTPEELMQAIFTHPSPLAGGADETRNILVKPVRASKPAAWKNRSQTAYCADRTGKS